jgi:hypothetical protein
MLSPIGARKVRVCLILVAAMLTAFSTAQTPSGTPVAGLTADQVVARLEQRNQERANALREFNGARTYHLQYRGFPSSRDAEMLVQMNFQAPASKRFTIVSQTGSKFIIEHVLMKLLETEQEALEEENRRRSALSQENYNFTLEGYEPAENSGRYVLAVTPRNKNKFLYQGRIWVDATDFAVTHIEGEPAKNPSFWIKKTSIQHQYEKIGDFWLPVQNRTESQSRFGGKALLTIDYTDYRITSATPIEKTKSASTQAMDTALERATR